MNLRAHITSRTLALAKGDGVTCVMTSKNFEFLRSGHSELADLGGFAEQYAFSDHASALVKLRTYAESMVKATFAHHQLEQAYQSKLNDLLHDHSFKSITPEVVQAKIHSLRIKGNHAAHGTLYATSDEQMADYIKEAYDLGSWFHLSVEGGRREDIPAFQALTKPSEDTKGELKRKTKAALQQIAQQEVLMAELLDKLDKARAQAESAKKSEDETKAVLRQAQQAANALEFSEEETRLKLIDEQLRLAGWTVGSRGKSTDEVGQEIKVLHQRLPSGKGRADYVLWAENGKPLAVIEAKKTSEDAQKGKMQAKYYADGLEKEHGQRPVIFYTNGYEIYIWNDAKGEPPRPLYGFYSRDSLEYELFQAKERVPKLGELHPKESIVDRLYQIEAVKRVSEKFDQRRRNALIIQATGTGKTRVSIALCQLMIQAKWAKRILFLCDRKELRKQAGEAFDDHLPSEPRVIVSRRTAGDRGKRIYLATYPAMMRCFQNFDVGFFDLVIADESHRSIYNRYRDLFRWFDAYQVGLTATPVKFVFRNTYKLFECENEDPTFNYTYEEAVSHTPAPYVCPFKVTKHTTKFLRKGIKYKNLTKEQQEQLDDQVPDPESVDFSPEEISRKVYNEDTDKVILQNLMQHGVRNADGTRLGKTIIFARNHKHAKLFVELFDKHFPQYGGDFCARIDNYEPRAEQLIDDFKSNDGSSNLTIAVSVDMLDTGIDVPEIVNLVFAKPVKSLAKFWQMIGRGTRLCPDLFGPGKDKQFFQIFDHWGNFEYFEELKEEKDPSVSKSLTEQLFEARLKLGETAVEKQDLATLKLVTKLLAADIAALPQDCLCVRDKWREIRAMQKPDVVDSFDPATVALLRTQIAPLMQWREVRGKEAAIKFDVLIARYQEAKLAGSASAADLGDQVIDEISVLPINIKQVAEKNAVIQQAKTTPYHQSATSEVLEDLRTELRGIMRHRKKGGGGRLEPLILNLKEEADGVTYGAHKVKLEGLDLAAYRNRVESVLRNLLEQSAALQKIRAGQAVAPGDIEALVDDVLLQDPDLHLDELLQHYPNKSESLELAIRQVIGLDSERVEEHFKAFVQKYPSLNANQIRFLDLLKSYLSRYGIIELDKLWEAPFTTIDSAGIDGVFTDGQQVDDLLDLLNEINQDDAA